MKPKEKLFRLLLLAAILILVGVFVLILIAVLSLVLVLILVLIHNKSSIDSYAVSRKDIMPRKSRFILRFEKQTHDQTRCDCYGNTACC